MKMPTSSLDSSRQRRPRLGRYVRFLLLIAAVACCGCQSVIPSAMPRSFASRQEKKIAKLAAADPFPSPADVGLAATP
jgi:hypothetical protein